MTAKRKPGAGFFSMPPAERKAAIDRIIVAASGPPDDENLLAADIEQADIDFDLHFDVKTARADNWRKLLKRIRKSLESNARLIDSDPILKRLAAPYELPRLVKFLGYTEVWQGRLATQHRSKKVRQPTPIEWLAGVTLPLMYEQRFSARVTFDRDDEEKPTGALIDFIEAVMAALGLTYSRESIARAITRLKTVRDNSRD